MHFQYTDDLEYIFMGIVTWLSNAFESCSLFGIILIPQIYHSIPTHSYGIGMVASSGIYHTRFISVVSSWIPWFSLQNFLKIAQCSVLEKWSARIFLVRNYFTDMTLDVIWPLINNCHTQIYLVLLTLDDQPLLSRNITIMLYWYITELFMLKPTPQ